MSAFVVSTDTIDLIVSALYEVQGPAKSSPLGLQEIGQILLDENYRSVNFRYDEKTPSERYTFLPVDLNAIPNWRVVTLKSLRCWQYQSCETDDFKATTAYSIAETLMGLLGVTDKHPAYQSAPWGWERTIAEPEPEPPAPVVKESLSTTEHAARIRQELKTKHGWNSRQVSVKARYYSMGSSIDVTIKDAKVSRAIVEAIASKAERIDRDQFGDILSGGNRFVHVGYDSDTLEAMGRAILPKVEAAVALIRDNYLIDVEGTPFMVGAGDGNYSLWSKGDHGSHLQRCYDPMSVAREIAWRLVEAPNQ